MVFPGPVYENAPLSSKTTLCVGGPARYLAEVETPQQLGDWLDFADQRQLPIFILGGGSNLVVADSGFPGLVLQMCNTQLRRHRVDDVVEVTLGAGLVWDDVVDWASSRGLAGVTCMSGIPGHIGAAPIQNIGAYGQELADTLVGLDAVELSSGKLRRFDAEACGFGYRHSHFKGALAGQYAVVSVTLSLTPNGVAPLTYRDLDSHFSGRSSPPSLQLVREAVISIRRQKSMVLDPNDPNSRSAGSFFVNPIIPESLLPEVERRVVRTLGADVELPRWPSPNNQVKLPAAWLIERAGFSKGHLYRGAGLSQHHCLALINRGHASATDILELALAVKAAVYDAFGVTLVPEPRPLGFRDEDISKLY